jgi:hypothetical protein
MIDAGSGKGKPFICTFAIHAAKALGELLWSGVRALHASAVKATPVNMSTPRNATSSNRFTTPPNYDPVSPLVQLFNQAHTQE